MVTLVLSACINHVAGARVGSRRVLLVVSAARRLIGLFILLISLLFSLSFRLAGLWRPHLSSRWLLLLPVLTLQR